MDKARNDHLKKVLVLSDKFAPLIDGEPHNVVIDALLNAFMAMAVAHPCCTQSAADMAARASEMLARRAARIEPQSPHLH